MTHYKSLLRIAMLSLCLGMASPASFAAWDDDRDTVLKKINNMKDKIDNIVMQLNKGKGPVGAGNIQDTIDAATALLGETIPSRPEMNEFKKSGCIIFRNDLTMLSNGMFDLGNSLTNFHGLPVEFRIQDPGLVDLIPRIPCEFLMPVDKVARKLPMFHAEFIHRLNNASSEIDLLKSIIYPQGSAATRSAEGINEGLVCEILRERESDIILAHNSVRTLGLLALGIGTTLQAIGKTALAGPDEVKVAIWGWVGSRIRNTPAMTLGNFLAGSGHALGSVSAMTSRTRNMCGLRQDHLKLQAELRSLHAAHQELKDGQDEIVRLLLTPHGRRSSGFCHDGECESRDFPLD